MHEHFWWSKPTENESEIPSSTSYDEHTVGIAGCSPHWLKKGTFAVAALQKMKTIACTLQHHQKVFSCLEGV